jgi:uncharacterized protein
MTKGLRVVIRRGAQSLLGILLVGSIVSAPLAQALQPVPAPTSHVVDTTNTLSADVRGALELKLSAFEAELGTQIGILLVATTAPEDIFSYANRVANLWKLGRKDVGDGLLVVVAKDDHKLRIEVAKTLEGAIPDLLAKRVIDQAITPAFKRGDFAGGLDAGADQLMALVRGEELPAPTSTSQQQAGFQWLDLAVFLFFAAAIGGSMARRIFGNRWGTLLVGAGTGAVAWLATSSLVVAGIAAVAGGIFTLLGALNQGRSAGHGSTWSTGSGSSGGWRSGGSSGGGFSSGGGGSFGGGGASGGW